MAVSSCRISAIQPQNSNAHLARLEHADEVLGPLRRVVGHGVVQRRAAERVRRVHARALLDQQVREPAVPEGARAHQRRDGALVRVRRHEAQAAPDGRDVVVDDGHVELVFGLGLLLAGHQWRRQAVPVCL